MSLYASCSCCWWLRRALKFLPWCYLLNHNLQRSDERCSLNFALIELEMFVGRSTLEYWTMERVYQKRTTKQPFTCHEQRARIWTFAVLMKFSPQTKKTWTFALFFALFTGCGVLDLLGTNSDNTSSKVLKAVWNDNAHRVHSDH